MVLPIPDLPDDVDALKAMISAMAEERAANEARLVAAQAEITRLEAVEKSAQRADCQPHIDPEGSAAHPTWHAFRAAAPGRQRRASPLPSRRSRPAFRRSRANLIALPMTSRNAPRVRARALPLIRTHRGGNRTGRPRRVRGAGEGSDRGRPLRTAGCRAAEVPGHRDAPPQIRFPGTRRRDPGPGADTHH